MGKRQVCWLPAFSPLPTIFLKCFYFSIVKKSGLSGKQIVKADFLFNFLVDEKLCAFKTLRKTPYFKDTRFDSSTTDSFNSTGGKEEMAHTEQFLLFPQCFLLNQITVSPFVHNFDIISLFVAKLEEPTIGI